MEFGQSGTGGEGAVRNGPEAVPPQSENTEGGQDGGSAGSHLWNLETHETHDLILMKWPQRYSISLIKNNSDGHLVACEDDLIDVRKNLEGGPGHTGEHVPGKQQNLQKERRKYSVSCPSVVLSVERRKLVCPLWSPPVTQIQSGMRQLVLSSHSSFVILHHHSFCCFLCQIEV